jgi:hypothetical protein
LDNERSIAEKRYLWFLVRHDFHLLSAKIYRALPGRSGQARASPNAVAAPAARVIPSPPRLQSRPPCPLPACGATTRDKRS